MLYTLLGYYNDDDTQIGMSDLVNLGIYYTGNRENRKWDSLKDKYAITTEKRDFLEHNYAGAEFDSSGFAEIITHIADGLFDP